MGMSVCSHWGGTPSQVWPEGGTLSQVWPGGTHPRSGWGVPHPRSGQGGTHPRSGWGGYPILGLGSTPSQVTGGYLGVSHPQSGQREVPCPRSGWQYPSQSGQGVPQVWPGGYPSLVWPGGTQS